MIQEFLIGVVVVVIISALLATGLYAVLLLCNSFYILAWSKASIMTGSLFVSIGVVLLLCSGWALIKIGGIVRFMIVWYTQ